jgi:hypothetical protein
LTIKAKVKYTVDSGFAGYWGWTVNGLLNFGNYTWYPQIDSMKSAYNGSQPNTTPSISCTVTALSAFSSIIPNPSSIQTYSIYGVNLIGNLIITVPDSFQISTNGTTWLSQIILTPTNGTVSSTTISVRMNKLGVGTVFGNITNVSTTATTKNVAVTGTALLNVPPTGCRIKLIVKKI